MSNNPKDLKKNSARKDFEANDFSVSNEPRERHDIIHPNTVWSDQDYDPVRRGGRVGDDLSPSRKQSATHDSGERGGHSESFSHLPNISYAEHSARDLPDRSFDALQNLLNSGDGLGPVSHFAPSRNTNVTGETGEAHSGASRDNNNAVLAGSNPVAGSSGSNGGRPAEPIVEQSNSAPTDIALSAHAVDENAVAGTVVATLSAADPDAGDRFFYTITDDPSGYFEISYNAGTWEVRVKAGATIDFESATSHDITIEVTDTSGNTFSEVVTLNVNDINEDPTDITLSANTVDENAAAGTVVATLAAADVDTGDSFSYAITNDSSGYFEIVGDEVRVKAGATIDFESAQSHDVTIEVTDAGGNTYSEVVTLNVNDLFDEAPTNIEFSGNSSLSANAAAGTVVASVSSVTDADAGDTFTYALTDDAGGAFTIDSATGDITNVNAIDSSSVSSYTLTVEATDAGGNAYAEDLMLHFGTDGDDAFTATADGDIVYGLGATDTISYANSDAAVAVNIDDSGNSTYDGTIGFAKLSGGYADGDAIYGMENIIGSAYDDIIDGNNFANILTGGDGNDDLDGDGGVDTLYGGIGDDTLRGGAGGDTIDGGAGVDTVSFLYNSGAVTIDLDDSGSAIYDGATGDGKLSGGRADGDSVYNVENVLGSSEDDSITGNVNANVLSGEEGNDTIDGEGGDDTLDGGDGDDTLIGGAGRISWTAARGSTRFLSRVPTPRSK